VYSSFRIYSSPCIAILGRVIDFLKHGISTAYPRYIHGISTVYPWYNHGITTAEPACIYGISMEKRRLKGAETVALPFSGKSGHTPVNNFDGKFLIIELIHLTLPSQKQKV
jgi:hypothetical protein